MKDRNFYRRIGERGGRAGKWSPAKRESARNAANIRWSRERAVAKTAAAIKESSSE
jgi:hypothetical protein